MAGLTVTEKEHWKERIGRRIDRRIEAITAASPGLMTRIRGEAKRRAEGSLGLTQLQTELDALAEEKKSVETRERDARRSLIARVRGIAVADLGNIYGSPHEMQEVTTAVAKRQAVHEDELLAEDEAGRQVLLLRAERDNLLDTVWLATSPAQIRALWSKVAELLGDEPTRLEREALAIVPIEEG